jgi:modulator of FtsH protease
VHDEWIPFFAAVAGAAGALTGLVFVALSINLSHIISEESLVNRALEALTLLAGPVLVGLAALVPASTVPKLGLATILPALACWLLVTFLLLRSRRMETASSYERPQVQVVTRIGLAELATLPAVLGSVLLLADSSTGYWSLAVSAVVSIAVGIIDAWVLLVEILR